MAVSLANGCAHVQPPSAATRAGFGTIGIVSSPGTEIKGDFGAPTRGKPAGAAKAAGMGALASVSYGAAAGNLLGLAIGVILSPAVALGSGVYGAVVAEPRAKVKEAEDSINSALKNIEIQQAMQGGVYKAAREKSSCNVIPVFAPVKDDPASPGDGVGYRDLKESGVDTALVVNVTEYGLGTSGQGLAIDPQLPFVLKARVRLVKCPDGKELYANTFAYKGEPRKFVGWAVNGAKPLVDEINMACDILARWVVDEALLGVPYAGGQPRSGSEPERTRGSILRDLFEPTDKHGWDNEDEGEYLW